jgi:hypothetical protein
MAFIVLTGYSNYCNKLTYSSQRGGFLQFRGDHSLQINASAPCWRLVISLINCEDDRGWRLRVGLEIENRDLLLECSVFAFFIQAVEKTVESVKKFNIIFEGFWRWGWRQCITSSSKPM